MQKNPAFAESVFQIRDIIEKLEETAEAQHGA